MTREHAPKPALLRIVLDPEGRPAIDVLGRAPGRGAYVLPDRDLVETALTRGFGRLFKGQGQALDAESAGRTLSLTEMRLAQRLADHIRFARRAGALVWGVAEVAADPEVALVVRAEDLSPRSAETLAAMDRPGLVHRVWGTKQVLGEILGKSEVAALGVRASVFVERILWDGERLRRLTNEARRPEGRAEPRSNDSRSHGEETDL